MNEVHRPDCVESSSPLEKLRFLTEAQVRELGSKVGTPVFVYSEERLREQALRFMSLPHAYGLSIRYSIKANPNRSLLRLFDHLGFQFDASSAWEAFRALAAGIKGERILVTAQEASHLDELVHECVEFTACSLSQLERYGSRFPGACVSLRVNPGTPGGSMPRLRSSGREASFGIWHELLASASEIAGMHCLKIRRLHVHIGSGNDPRVWLDAARRTLELARRFPEVSVLNLGGGFLVPSMSSDSETDYVGPAEHLARLIRCHAKQTGQRLHLELEPGTYLMANVGSLIARVDEVVSTGTKGFEFLKLDAGLTEIARPALYGSQHPLVVVPLAPERRNEVRRYVVVGHCCIAGDLLTVDSSEQEPVRPRRLLRADAGDFLVIERAGAYCASMSLKNFNSFPEAPEVLQTSGGAFLEIRRRQTLEQILQNESNPEWRKAPRGEDDPARSNP